MTENRCFRASPSSRGFTLIEVVAAFVIFASGVLMVIRLTTTLSEQMIYAAKASELVVETQERLDSLEALDFDSLTVGTTSDTVSIRGTSYARTATITQVTAVLYQLDVTMSPLGGASGPTYSAESYAAAPW